MATYKFFLMLVLLFAFLYCNDTKPHALQRQWRWIRTTRRRRYGGIPNNPNIPCPNNTLSNKTCTFIQYGVTGTNGTGRRLCRRPDGGICSKLKHGYQKYGTCRNGTCAI
uniref:Uncharacterized protein n=1 Tax=Rhipicephalus zambeziensis TaxID=60191 RepID=A0A224YIJ0_9ACAR